MPDNINNYIEPFVGGGSSYLNSKGNKYILNDIDEYVIKLHKSISSYKDNPAKLFERLFNLIDKYELSCSYRNICVPDDLKKKYVKTYYAKYNKDAYIRLRNDFNKNKDDILLLYLLLIYGFNHMIRFNSSGNFNLPVGNVDFNKNVFNALNSYLDFAKNNTIIYKNKDYKDFLNSVEIKDNDYVFLDPPYLISGSEYNKLWNEEKEHELCKYLDTLNEEGIKWGITNLINHKGRKNTIFIEWAKKYNIYNIKSNYISFNDNTVKEDSREVFVSNVKR